LPFNLSQTSALTLFNMLLDILILKSTNLPFFRGRER